MKSVKRKVYFVHDTDGVMYNVLSNNIQSAVDVFYRNCPTKKLDRIAYAKRSVDIGLLSIHGTLKDYLT